MVVRGFFADKRRERIRRKTKVGLFEDYVLRSEVTDYYRLRLLVNAVLGVFICSCLYYLGWKRLNFADFHPFYGVLFKWFMIISTVYAFASSPLFRCAMFCLLLGAMGKNGQAPLTMLVFDQLREGPVENIVTNYKLTAEILVCHLQLQARIASNRIAMFTGPLEEMLEKQLKRGLKVLKDSTNFVRKLIAPFLRDLSEEPTKEDERLDEADRQLAMLARRRELGVNDDRLNLEQDEMTNMTNSKPDWTSFKTSVGRRIAARMSKRCNDIFTKGVDKCREMFAGLQKKCSDVFPVFIGSFVCSKMNMETACEDIDRKRKSISICSSNLADSHIGSGIEKELQEMTNMTKNIKQEMKINLHMLMVDSPRLEVDYSLVDITQMVKHAVHYVKAILTSTKQIVRGLFIFFVYQIFRDSVRMIDNYRKNVEFNNCFVNNIFWQIDAYRAENGQMALYRIDSCEMKRWKLLKVFSFPTKAEIRKAKKPFYRWLILTLVVILVIIVDYYLYDFLHQIVTSSDISTKGVAESAQFEVLGEGVVADFMNKMIHFNQSVKVDEGSLSNEHCLIPPKKPNFAQTMKWIITPLIISLFMQVIFSFVVKRVVINYFLPFIFPLRDRVRIIYLYNKILFLRAKHRKEARARIRFVATRWKINDEYDEGGWFSTRSWFKLKVLDRVFRTGQCLMCEMQMRPSSLCFCDSCPATYCSYCLKEMHGECYACQAEEGVVDTEESQKSLESQKVVSTENFLSNEKKASQE